MLGLHRARYQPLVLLALGDFLPGPPPICAARCLTFHLDDQQGSLTAY